MTAGPCSNVVPACMALVFSLGHCIGMCGDEVLIQGFSPDIVVVGSLCIVVPVCTMMWFIIWSSCFMALEVHAVSLHASLQHRSQSRQEVHMELLDSFLGTFHVFLTDS